MPRQHVSPVSQAPLTTVAMTSFGVAEQDCLPKGLGGAEIMWYVGVRRGRHSQTYDVERTSCGLGRIGQTRKRMSAEYERGRFNLEQQLPRGCWCKGCTVSKARCRLFSVYTPSSFLVPARGGRSGDRPRQGARSVLEGWKARCAGFRGHSRQLGGACLLCF